MFKKAHLTILLSLLLHVVIVLLLNNSQTMVIPNANIKPASIKSYIYQTPKVEPVVEVNNVTPPPEPKKVTPIKPPQQTVDEVPTQAKVMPSPEPPPEKITDIKNESSAKVIKGNAQKKATPKSTTQKQQTFSYQALHKLREKIQQQTNDQYQRELTQPNTGSVMHGTPTLVPHSTVPQSKDEKKKQATLSMSADKSLIKGDDGNCLLVEDLSVVGIEGVTAVSSFSCGETKFDKSFREHLDKVRKKFGKK